MAGIWRHFKRRISRVCWWTGRVFGRGRGGDDSKGFSLKQREKKELLYEIGQLEEV